MADRRPIRCAIYTRKSSEEGLEQSFNSLDAQREACRAYVESQRHEGWRPITTHYDDGGYSGGTMERPALKRLLEDISAGKVDAVVVYKVDRLTRSLSDFAKIIDVFDKRGASFVSVTQQFNTTSSMGRLTLNVLLSFAQFEREVTGERIRDKIAASKRKGMWMGGNVPLGYNLKKRKLLVNRQEATLVRDVYRRYLALGCVRKLKLCLDRSGIRSKLRVSPSGRRFGGAAYSRGALYKILRNRIYLGEIEHREQVYVGEHEAIVPRKLWERVQATLRTNNDARRNGTHCSAPSLMVGLVFDELGNRYTPSHTVKDGKRYRYYISQAAIKHDPARPGSPPRVPAHEVESIVASLLREFLERGPELARVLVPRRSQAQRRKVAEGIEKRRKLVGDGSHGTALRELVDRVVIHRDTIEVFLSKNKLRLALLGNVPSSQLHNGQDAIRLSRRFQFARCGIEKRLLIPGGVDVPRKRSQPLVKAVARGREWYERLTAGEVGSRRAFRQSLDVDESYIGRIIRCAFLAPDIVECVLDGNQPPDLTLQTLQRAVPADWSEQRRLFGLASR